MSFHQKKSRSTWRRPYGTYEGDLSSQKAFAFWGLFSEVLRIYTKWLPQRSQNYPNHPFGAAKRPPEGYIAKFGFLWAANQPGFSPQAVNIHPPTELLCLFCMFHVFSDPFGVAKRPQMGSLLSLASLRQPFCIYSENFWEEASELNGVGANGVGEFEVN